VASDTFHVHGTKKRGIIQLYSEFSHELTSQLAKLHGKPDAIALEACAWNAKDNLLEKLLKLNLKLAEKEKSREVVKSQTNQAKHGD
jgi:hypothetical protein